jgi:hypothetical protein
VTVANGTSLSLASGRGLPKGGLSPLGSPIRVAV